MIIKIKINLLQIQKELKNNTLIKKTIIRSRPPKVGILIQ